MKYFFLIFLFFSQPILADFSCLPPEKAHMPKVADIQIPNSVYTVDICYLPEKIKNEIHEDFQKDLIVLKKAGSVIAHSETKISLTVGRISDLIFEKKTDRFIALTYEAGEFCNGVVIFDTKLKKAAFQHGCVSESSECHVTSITDSKCSAKVKCFDKDSEKSPSKSKVPYNKIINLCH